MSEVNIFTRGQRDLRRVVVTGIGSLTPLGLNYQESWSKAVEGQSGIDRIQAFDPSGFDCQIAGEVKGFNADDWISKKEQKKMDRFIHFALACADMALKDADLSINEELSQRAGALIGVGMGGMHFLEKQIQTCYSRGPGRISPFFIPGTITNLASGHVSIIHNLKGPNYSVTSACASAAHSIGEALEYIRRGRCDVMLAGGSEAVVCQSGVGGFAAMKALSTRNDQPQIASRPWDKDRDGFVLAEGAALLVLEDYEFAKRRGAQIYAEVTGYGVSSDANHMTNPSPGGEGPALAMSYALQDAGLNPEDIDYINAHGTSTPAGDEMEAMAVKRVFKEAAYKIMVSSTKSMMGHSLGAAGAIESMFTLMALKHNLAPPTINLDNPSDGCDLDFVPGSAREKPIKHALNNSFGFGGTNASLIFSKLDA